MPAGYALVTGASSGIGWHLSVELAKKGYSIVAVSNQADKLEDLRLVLERAYGISVVVINTDLGQEAAAQNIFDVCRDKGLTVDVLINNAGTLVFGEAVKAVYRDIRQILMLHVVTPSLLCRLFGELMVARKRGFILNVASISAVMPYPRISFYGPSKTFLRSFTRALRFEMKPKGINVTCLIPGATRTGLYNTERYNITFLKKLGIMKSPEEVARPAVRALFRNRAECIPGLLNKLIVSVLPLIPHFVIGLIGKKALLSDEMGHAMA